MIDTICRVSANRSTDLGAPAGFMIADTKILVSITTLCISFAIIYAIRGEFEGDGQIPKKADRPAI